MPGSLCAHLFSGNQDYYGIDIDLTARVQAQASQKQVVIEKRLYDEIANDYLNTGNRNAFESFLKLEGPTPTPLHGIPKPVDLFKTVS